MVVYTLYMVLFTHIVIALGSLFYTGYVIFFPSKPKLYISYALVAFTIISGFYLIFTKPSHITQTCITGLLYLGAISFFLFSAHHRLANSKENS